MDSVATLSLALQSQVGSGPGLTARGAWAIGTSYVANDVVTRSGLTYVNVLANTGSDPATDGGVHWALSSGVAQPGAMTALFAALQSGVAAMLASRIARRRAILQTSTGGQWNYLPPGVDDGAVSQNYLEVREVANLQGNLQSFASNIARVNDPMVLNTHGTVVADWATALVGFAASYETMELETLPG